MSSLAPVFCLFCIEQRTCKISVLSCLCIQDYSLPESPAICLHFHTSVGDVNQILPRTPQNNSLESIELKKNQLFLFPMLPTAGGQSRFRRTPMLRTLILLIRVLWWWWWWIEHWWNYNKSGKPKKSAPFCPPHFSHWIARNGTRASRREVARLIILRLIMLWAVTARAPESTQMINVEVLIK